MSRRGNRFDVETFKHEIFIGSFEKCVTKSKKYFKIYFYKIRFHQAVYVHRYV